MVGVVPLRPSRAGKSGKGLHAAHGPRVAQPCFRGTARFSTPSSGIYLTKTIIVYCLAFCLHIKVPMFEVKLNFFLSLLPHIYRYSCWHKLLQKNYFPPGDGAGTVIII